MNLKSLALLAAVALIAGCATTPDRTAHDNIDLSRFRAVNVAPIQFSGEALGNIADGDRAQVADELRSALLEGVAPSPREDVASAGAVRIEVTVTELDASSPTVNLLTTALLFVPLDAGGVSFEARFYDGASDAPFARTTYRHTSTPLDLKGSFSRYGHAAKALRDWAKEITSIRYDARASRSAAWSGAK